MMEKIAKAKADGTLGPKVRAKVKDAWPVHAITDGGVRESFDEVAMLRKLRKRFVDQIEAGVPGIEHVCNMQDKIWVCWLQGIEDAPAIVRACVSSCLEANSDHELVMLSQENLADYVDLPGYIMDKHAKGIIPAAHFSDLIRAELLYRHGGVWADSTVLFTGGIPDYVWDSPLFVFKSLDLLHRGERPTVCSSWFIRSQGDSKILAMTRELLLEYWKDSRYLDNYFLFHICFALAAERYDDEWKNVPTFNNHSPHVMGFELDKPYSEVRWEQLVSMSAIHKLNRYHDYSADRASLYSHILDKYES